MNANTLKQAIELTVIAYLALAALTGTLTIAVTATKLRRVWAGRAHTLKYRDVLRGDTVGITILLPVHNDGDAAIRAVEHFTGLAYPRLELILINDGSSDRTMNLLRTGLDLKEESYASTGRIRTQDLLGVYRSGLWPNLRVVDKLHGGRADALNAGLNLATHPLICLVGVKTRLTAATLLIAADRFASEPELAALSAALTPRVERNLFGSLQLQLHARAVASKTCQGKMHAFTRVDDGFTVVRRQGAENVGGFESDSNYAADLVVRLQLRARRRDTPIAVRFHPDPAGETDAPASLRELCMAWSEEQRGLSRIVTLERLTRLRPRHGRFAWLTLPWLAFEALTPVLESLAAVALLVSAIAGVVSWAVVALAFAVIAAIGSLHNLLLLQVDAAAARRDDPGDRSRQLAAAVLANLGLRQLETLTRAWAALATPRRTHA